MSTSRPLIERETGAISVVDVRSTAAFVDDFPDRRDATMGATYSDWINIDGH